MVQSGRRPLVAGQDRSPLTPGRLFRTPPEPSPGGSYIIRFRDDREAKTIDLQPAPLHYSTERRVRVAVADNSRPFRLYCDSSIDGFGATLEQEQPDGSVRPVLFISRATLDFERSWTPLDLEAVSIVWAIERRRGHLWSTHFQIYSDHKAPENIAKIGEHNARVRRWLEFLSAYTYTLEYRKGTANGNADFLS